MPGKTPAERLAEILYLQAELRRQRLEDSVGLLLASGLVVPASDLLDLAQQWDDMASAGDSAAAWFATELRALTQQEDN